MIEGFRMMAVAARTSGGKHQKDIAEVYDMAALCIENEALRDAQRIVMRRRSLARRVAQDEQKPRLRFPRPP